MTRIEMTMKLPVVMSKDDADKWYIACCPILDVITQGETETKAKENLADALYLFLTSCYERGTLDIVLKESGFRLVDHVNYTTSNDVDEYIDIPFHLLSNKGSDQVCRA